MKRLGTMVLAIVVALGISALAGAKKKEAGGEAGAQAAKSGGADKSYSNSDYRLSLRYPGDWDAKEEKVAAPEMGEGVGALLGKKMMGGMRMTTVCFGSGKCEAGKSGKDPQAELMIADLTSMERISSMGRKGVKSEKGARGEPAKSDCEEIEHTSVKWGGTSAPWITTRCPEKKKWRYRTAVTMQRGAAKGKDMYNLSCSMLSKSDDKTASLSEYQGDLKPRCQKMVSTTKFGK